MSDALRDEQPLTDAAFDRIYPEWVRQLSSLHWTPVAVARQAVRLLAVRPAMQLLDAGAGAGKLCIVGALTTDARWTGLERRTDLCTAGRLAARELGADVALRRGDFLDADWARFDGLYFYNPVASLVGDLRDLEPEARLLAYQHGTDLLQAKLATLRPGTRVVTYHGFGGTLGAVPAAVTRVASHPIGTDALEVWTR